MTDKLGLHPQDGVGEPLRAVARHIVERARAAVADRDRIEAITVHQFRAVMKRWRAFLRLVEPMLDRSDRNWRHEARELARALTSARDIQSALDAVVELEHHAASHRLSSQSWATMRQRLEALRTNAETASLTPAMRVRIGAALDRAAARIEHWPLDTVTFGDVARGLAGGYRTARRALPDDWRAADLQELHRLRQHVIVHRYQIEIVEPLWPRLGRNWVKEAQRLRTQLGQCQDLAMLERLAAPHQPLARWRSPLLAAITHRQAQHVDAAARHAARLFAEQPKAFRRRLKAMWDGAAHH